MYLTSSEAQKMLQAAQAKAQQMGVKASISVVDGRGDLLTMVRLDGVSWRTAGKRQGIRLGQFRRAERRPHGPGDLAGDAVVHGVRPRGVCACTGRRAGAA